MGALGLELLLLLLLPLLEAVFRLIRLRSHALLLAEEAASGAFAYSEVALAFERALALIKSVLTALEWLPSGALASMLTVRVADSAALRVHICFLPCLRPKSSRMHIAATTATLGSSAAV